MLLCPYLKTVTKERSSLKFIKKIILCFLFYSLNIHGLNGLNHGFRGLYSRMVIPYTSCDKLFAQRHFLVSTSKTRSFTQLANYMSSDWLRDQHCFAYAIDQGDYERVNAYLRQSNWTSGLDINRSPTGAGLPIAIATARGHTDIVELLLDYGANPNIRNGGKGAVTPLIIAAYKGYEEITRLLLRADADIMKTAEKKVSEGILLPSYEDYTAFEVAMERRHPQIAELLLRAEHRLLLANPDLLERSFMETVLDTLSGEEIVTHINEQTLDTAISRGYGNLVPILLSAGDNLGIDLDLNHDHLEQAIHAQSPEIITILLERGVTPLENSGYKNILKVATLQNSPMLIQTVLDAGVDVDTPFDDAQMTTASMLAAQYRNIEALQTLIKNGANLSIRDSNAYTALDWSLEPRFQETELYDESQVQVINLLIPYTKDNAAILQGLKQLLDTAATRKIANPPVVSSVSKLSPQQYRTQSLAFIRQLQLHSDSDRKSLRDHIIAIFKDTNNKLQHYQKMQAKIKREAEERTELKRWRVEYHKNGEESSGEAWKQFISRKKSEQRQREEEAERQRIEEVRRQYRAEKTRRLDDHNQVSYLSKAEKLRRKE